MRITSSAISLNVTDEQASATFLRDHFGFTDESGRAAARLRGRRHRRRVCPLERSGLTFTTPIETEPWGERFFQVTDPNGVFVQLVQWMTEPGQGLRLHTRDASPNRMHQP